MQSKPDPTALHATARMVIPSDPHAVREALRSLVACPPLDHLTEGQRGSVELVLAEVLNNIVKHAYARSSGFIDISVEARPAGIGCLVVDAGAALPQAVLSGGSGGGPVSGPDDLPEGGFGWHLIRALTVELSYQRKAGRNHLSFVVPT